MIKAAVMVLTTRTVVKMTTETTLVDMEMITVNILDIGQSLAMIIISMSISKIIDITAIGILGIRGKGIKEVTPIMRDMVIMKGIITNCFSCSMME